MDDNQHDGELIGLHNPANGRSCHQHECCGPHVRIGTLIRFKVGLYDGTFRISLVLNFSTKVREVLR
jgi:hypothetical protein